METIGPGVLFLCFGLRGLNPGSPALEMDVLLCYRGRSLNDLRLLWLSIFGRHRAMCVVRCPFKHLNLFNFFSETLQIEFNQIWYILIK